MQTRGYKSKSVATAVITGFLFVSVAGAVFAHEGMEHGDMRRDEAMSKQHHMMDMYAQTQVKINESLRKNDAKAVEVEAGKILDTISSLKALTPHNNLKERKALPKIAAAFESNMKTVETKAKKGDIAGARTAFRKAEKRCNECHAKFRD